jgi:hypothetical protein
MIAKAREIEKKLKFLAAFQISKSACIKAFEALRVYKSHTTAMKSKRKSSR